MSGGDVVGGLAGRDDGGWFGAVDAGTAVAVERCLPQDLAVLPLQLGVQVGVQLVDDGGELVDQLPHRQGGLPALQDEEDRSQVELDRAPRRCRRCRPGPGCPGCPAARAG